MNNRREQVGWYFYDWANSAFSTVVVTTFLGPYLTAITEAAARAGGDERFVYPLGIAVAAKSFFPYLVSMSVGLQVLFLPILGAIADYSNRKKEMLAFFAYIGAFATMLLYFLDGTNYLFGAALFLVANLAFGASIVFYNAYLPEISTASERDTVSSRGWAAGYLGGGVILALNLAFFLNADKLGMTGSEAVRIALFSAGLWWALFTLVPLFTLQKHRPAKPLPPGQGYLTTGFRQLSHTFRSLRNYPQTLLFLVAYLLYNDGIQTVISQSAVFAEGELGVGNSTLTSLILMLQFVAFGGALFFGWLAKRIGAKRAILISLVIWIGNMIFAYAVLQSVAQLFALGVAIGIVLGGTQALSRSAFSLMIPQGQEAEYFSLYEVSERGTSWLGPLLFGLALQYTDSYRIAILSLVIFFVLGFILLTRVDIRRAAQEAGNEAPALG